MGVDGDVVVAIAAHAARGLHHTGDLKSGNRRFARGKEQALDLRGQLQVLHEAITLLLNFSGKRFSLFDIPLDEVNHEGEAQRCREIVMYPNPRVVDCSRRIVVVQQDTSHDEEITEFSAQKNRAYAKREDVEVGKRNRNSEMVRIGDGGNRPQDQYQRQPRWSI